jgi:predicted protein tyrosine phosphatase
MSAAAFLSRLSQVRKTGAETWIACCPAHEDKRPSMSIREVDDGRLLVHCFAGCSFEEIAQAAGASLDEFFPEKPLYHRAKPIRRPFPAADVLECLSFEAAVVYFAATDLAQGKALPEEERQRLMLAQRRIREAVEVANA